MDPLGDRCCNLDCWSLRTLAVVDRLVPNTSGCFEGAARNLAGSGRSRWTLARSGRLSFQSFAQSRFSGALREFESYVFAVLIVLFGLTSLVVDGLALLGLGRDAPGGWAGAWAVSLSLVSIGLLPVLTIVLLRGLEPRRMHTRRLEHLRALVEREIDDDLRNRLGVSELNKACEASGWQFQPFFGTPEQELHPIQAKANGVVTDVRLQMMPKLSNDGSASTPTMLVRLGQFVAAGQTLALVPKDPSWKARSRARRLVVVKSAAERPTSALEDGVESLHPQVMQAYKDSNTIWYEEIAEAYLTVMTALPTAWARYGERFERGVANAFDLVSRFSNRDSDSATPPRDADCVPECRPGTCGRDSFTPVSDPARSEEARRWRTDRVYARFPCRRLRNGCQFGGSLIFVGSASNESLSTCWSSRM